MLTKKHYKAIANIINEASELHQETMDEKRIFIAHRLADYLGQEYDGVYAFDRERFLQACGLEE